MLWQRTERMCLLFSATIAWRSIQLEICILESKSLILILILILILLISYSTLQNNSRTPWVWSFGNKSIAVYTMSSLSNNWFLSWPGQTLFVLDFIHPNLLLVPIVCTRSSISNASVHILWADCLIEKRCMQPFSQSVFMFWPKRWTVSEWDHPRASCMTNLIIEKLWKQPWILFCKQSTSLVLILHGTYVSTNKQCQSNCNGWFDLLEPETSGVLTNVVVNRTSKERTCLIWSPFSSCRRTTADLIVH